MCCMYVSNSDPNLNGNYYVKKLTNQQKIEEKCSFYVDTITALYTKWKPSNTVGHSSVRFIYFG